MATRRTNKRTRRNRGRFGGLYKLFSFLLILVVIVAGCAVFFRVEEITVVGQSKYTAEEIIAATGIQKGDNLFLLSPVGHVPVTLPYVGEIAVRRALPDGVVITVRECVPALMVQGEGGWWVVDGRGKLLEAVPSGDRAGTAKVVGLTAILPKAGTRLAVDTLEASKLQSLLDLTAAFTGRGMMDKVSQVDLTGTARLTLTYDGRFTVVLPLSADFDRAGQALSVIVEEKLQANDTGKIDMSSLGQAKEAFTFSPN